MQIVINGKFLEDRIHGITRYALNILIYLDKLISKNDLVELVCPINSFTDIQLENIKIIKYGKHKGIFWEMTDLKKYVRIREAICLSLCNTMPLIKTKAVTTIHDIMYRTDFKTYRSLKNRLSAIWHRFQYSYITKHSTYVVTDSEYCKEQIEKYYPKSHGKIEVVYCGWQHVLLWNSNDDWEERYPFLKKGEFFFSLASLSKNKNGKWIVEIAKKNPNASFVIGGKFYNDSLLKENLPNNVHLLGYITDSDACSLIKNCKAFLFPSLNEGFGLPPLEALALGAKVISSNRRPMIDILGSSVHYVDPLNYDVNLEAILSKPVSSPQTTLQKNNWDVSAKKIYDLLKKCSSNK